MAFIRFAIFLLTLFVFGIRGYSLPVADTLRLNNPPPDPSSVNKRKLAIIGGVTAVGLLSTYIYIQEVWWKDQQTSFHIDHDKDYVYAKNMDKAAHFIGGVMTAQVMKASFYWAGMKPIPAYLYAGAMGTALQLIIEVKDGFSPTYGFSVGDVLAGSAGSFIPLLKYHFPKSHAVNIKLSYFRKHTYYYDVNPKANVVDDYMNQTYWLALSLNDWLPKNSAFEKAWPDFLTITGGFSIDDTWNRYYTGVSLPEDKGKGHYEYLISLDIDWRKILPQNRNLTKALSDALNYVKLPLPALRLGPSVQGYWVYW